jgi:hypothetical protein
VGKKPPAQSGTQSSIHESKPRSILTLPDGHRRQLVERERPGCQAGPDSVHCLIV